MEYLNRINMEKRIQSVWIILSCLQVLAAADLYPFSGHTAMDKSSTAPEHLLVVFPPNTLMPMFGVNIAGLDIDKAGGLYQWQPDTPARTIFMWMDADIHYVNHPTATAYRSDAITQDTDGVLSQATSEVRQAFDTASFTASWIVINTYDGYTFDGTGTGSTNSFQLVFISNGTETYVQFIYDISWWQDSSGKYPKMGMTVGGVPVITLPGSGTSAVATKIPLGNIPNQPGSGRWMFRIDGTCPDCTVTNSGYSLFCIDGDNTKCACSACLADFSPTTEGEILTEGYGLTTGGESLTGLSKDDKTIIIVTTTIGGVALIGLVGGLIYYFKKKNK